jgi:hypothetical protein
LRAPSVTRNAVFSLSNGITDHDTGLQPSTIVFVWASSNRTFVDNLEKGLVRLLAQPRYDVVLIHDVLE